MQSRYNFPTEIQHWIIGKRFPRADETLLDCGIRESGHTVYLYLISSASANIDREPAGAWGERLDGGRGLNRASSTTDVAAHQGSPNEVLIPPQNDPRSLPNMTSVKVREPPPEPVIGWTCPMCTYVNSPLRPGCEMCSTDRPQNYQIPDNYMPDERDKERIQRAQVEEQLLFQVRWRCYDFQIQKQLISQR